MNILKINLIVAGLLLLLPAARAQAQCPTFQGQIMQACINYEGAPFTEADLQQLESDAVTTYLQLHHLPASASSIIYQYGRADVRDAIRALMLDDLIRIITNGPQTPHEQALLTWFTFVVDNLANEQYAYAQQDANAWIANPCTWTMNATIAAAYGLTYDAGEYCSGNPLVTGFAPGAPVPSTDYFVAAGLQKSFGEAVTGFPYGSATEEDLQIQGYRMYGYAAAPAAGLSAAAALATYQYFVTYPSSQMIAVAEAESTDIMLTMRAAAQAAGRSFEGPSTEEAIQAATDAATDALDSSAAADFAAGPAAIVLIAVEIGVEAGFDFIDYSDAVSQLSTIGNNPLGNFPALTGWPTDPTGLYKLSTAFTSQTLPDSPSTQPLPQHRNGVDAWFILQPPTGPATESQTLTYTDLAGTQWSVQTYQGFFLQTGTQTNGTVVTTMSPTLTITDPQGVTWTVDWDGPTFLLTQTQPASTDTVCAANPTAGVSIVTNYETCSSYVAYSFTLQDGTIVSLGQSPVFTSDPIVTLPAGTPFSVTITAAGLPGPTISAIGGLSPGFTASGGKNGSLTLSGLASIPAGTYTIPFKAINGTGAATQTLTLVLGTAPQIVSPAQFNDNGGVATTFTIHVAGNPAPSISLQPGFSMPPGYTFHDNGNGTATISGDDVSSTPCGCEFYGGTVTATNSLGTASQALTINFVPASPALIDGGSLATITTTFIPGMNNTLVITTTGATTPVTLTNDDVWPTPMPPWLRFQDNGNGTATYFGNPPPTATPYSFSTAVIPNTAGFGPYLAYPITIQVTAAPAFTDTGSKLYLVGQVNNEYILPVDTDMATGTLSLSGTAPAGLTFAAPYPNEGQLHFKTATGGAYPFTIDATNSYGSASQVYTFYMQQLPGFPTAINNSMLSIWLMANIPASYSIPTTGYPHDIGVTAPGGTQILPPMQLSLESPNGFTETLPAGLTLSDQTSAGIPTGTALISGTPTQTSGQGPLPLTLKANNGQTKYLNINLYVRVPGDINNDGEVNCTDVNVLKAALGSYAGQPNYNVQADINNDGAVNVLDLALVAKYLPQGCPEL